MNTELQAPSIKRAYDDDGFHIHPQPLVPSDVIARAVAGMDAIRRGEYDTGNPPMNSPWKPGDDERMLCKIEMPQLASRGVMEIISHPAIGKLAAALTDAAMVQVWWVQLLYKPSSSADTGTNVGWHQDRQYWSAWEQGSEIFTAWVALSDVDVEAGPMLFLRGSHRWGLLKEGDFFGQNHRSQREALCAHLPPGAVWEEVPAVMAAGGASFHDDLTVHGSGPNRSSRPRRSFAIHLRTERSAPKDGKLEGLTSFIEDESKCPVIFRR